MTPGTAIRRSFRIADLEHRCGRPATCTDPHPGNSRLFADGRLGVLDFGAVDRLPDGFPPVFGRVLRLMHEDAGLAELETESSRTAISGTASALT